MDTSTLLITLPGPMKAFVEAEAAQQGYRSPDEYIQTLIREAQKRKALEKVDALLLEGLDSGEATDMTEADWENLRQSLRDRLAGRNSS